MASITIVTEGGEESHPLGAAAVVLGRGLESDVRLKDIKASRRHCQIVKTPQGFQIVDLSSGNGTFVNGVQVRQQLLAPGDKIQIGSTTLTFTEGAATKPPPRPPPASAFAEAPADKPSPAASPVAATARVAPVPSTGHAPAVKAAAPSAGSTSKLSAAKPASQAMPRPPAPVTDQPRSSSVRKPGLSRPTGALRGATRTRDGSPAAKSPAGKILAIAGAAVLLGGAAFFLFGGGGASPEKLEAQVRKLESEAAAARKAGRFDEAKARYQSLVAAIEGNDKFKKKNVEAKLAIEKLDLLATADKRFAAFKSRAEKPKEGESAELLREGKGIYEECSGEAFAWLKELRDINDRLEKSADSNGGAKRLDFSLVRNEIGERCKLASDAPQYAQALGEWRAFAGDRKVSDENRQKAQTEIAALQAKAKDDAARLRGRAEAMARENKKAEAIDELKSQRPRFKDTAGAEEIEAIIRDLEK